MHSSLLTDPLAITNDSDQPNFDAEDDADFQERIHRLKWIAYGVIAPIIIGAGVVGNLLNLAVLTRPNLKGVMYTYLTWLAISDLLSLVFTIPTLLRFTGINFTDFFSAFYHAHLELALVNFFMACSVFIVVAVTVDRYFSVSKPTEFKKVHTHNRARLSIVTSYVASFLLYIPVCFFKEVHAETEASPSVAGGRTRYVVRENFTVSRTYVWTVYLWIKESLVRLGPTVVLTILNIVIIVAFQRVVRKRKQLLVLRMPCSVPGSSPGMRSGTTTSSSGENQHQQQQQQQSSANFQEERRLVMLLIGIVIMFIVTMTPAAFLTLFMSNEKERSYNFQAFRAFANNMEFVNYAMNFYLYCLCSSEFRATFLQLFHLLKPQMQLGQHNLHPPVAGQTHRLQVNMEEQPTTTVSISKI